MSMSTQARVIAATLGYRSAAVYMRRRGISFHEAIRVLTGKIVWR